MPYTRYWASPTPPARPTSPPGTTSIEALSDNPPAILLLLLILLLPFFLILILILILIVFDLVLIVFDLPSFAATQRGTIPSYPCPRNFSMSRSSSSIQPF